MVTLTFHGQSCWEVQGSQYRILFDPFLKDNNPAADVGPDAFDTLDAILITHGHGDHVADVEAVAKNTDALIVSNFEIAAHFESKGCKSHPMHIGGAREFPFGRVKLTMAQHGSTGPNGEALGCPTGIILEIDGRKIYHAGDTGVFLDMKLIAELNGPFDVALLPIGDNFTMGVDDAVVAAKFIGAKMTLPMHYNTWPVIEVNDADFIRGVEAGNLNAQVVEPGASYDIP
jgi:L-ascorbate metabolism protein UlaG (beta-lactamase superfamily)